MAQISKIRIVNFSYNDGRKLIADELYDFECEGAPDGIGNVLINLANGGGKSVLVQLMMQPIIPKASVAGRNIESFFTKSTDHCFVVLEWQLDNSPMRLMTGIAMSAADAVTDSDADRGFRVKYYTFCATYRNSGGKYDILSLPLSRNDHNKFIPAMYDDIRSLAKRSAGELERFSSEENPRWRDRLAQFGIVQGEWRMIERLNSTEGGLSKYFSALSTSDAVIDKLIIPQIEDKQKRSLSEDDSTLSTMLRSYAVKYSKQKSTIKKKEILTAFHLDLTQMRTLALKLWTSADERDNRIKELFGFLDALTCSIADKEARVEQLEIEQLDTRNQIIHINWEQASARYYEDQSDYLKKKEESDSALINRDNASENEAAAQKRLRIVESAKYYERLEDTKNTINSLNLQITNKENDTGAAYELGVLKYSALCAINLEQETTAAKENQLNESVTTAQSELKRIGDEITALQKQIDDTTAELNKSMGKKEDCKQSNDDLVSLLSIGAIRMLDERYADAELQKWRNRVVEDKQQKEVVIDNLKEHAVLLENRRNAIPDERADERAHAKECQKDIEGINREIAVYEENKGKTISICEKYALDKSLIFTDNVVRFLEEQIELTTAAVADTDRKIEATDEAISAVSRGVLHIPKSVLSFLDQSGIRYTSFERYILDKKDSGTLSEAEISEILEINPHAAYGIIVDEKEYAKLLGDAEESKLWLTSLLPVYDYDDVEAILAHNALPYKSIAMYAKEYFKDSSSYAGRQKSILDTLHGDKKRLETRLYGYKAQMVDAQSFTAYDEEWSKHAGARRDEAIETLANINRRIEELDAEQKRISEEIHTAQTDLERQKRSLSECDVKLEKYDILCAGLEREYALAQQISQYNQLDKELRDRRKSYDSEKSAKEELLSTLKGELQDTMKLQEALKEGLETVRDAAETETVEGGWQALLTQYNELLESQNKELQELIAQRSMLTERQVELEQELYNRGCEVTEYVNVTYSVEAENNARKEAEQSKAITKAAQSAYVDANSIAAKAEAKLESSTQDLAEYGGEALALNEIGSEFDSRKEHLKYKEAELKKQQKAEEKAIVKLGEVRAKSENTADHYVRPDNVEILALTEDNFAQAGDIINNLNVAEKSVLINEQQIRTALTQMSAQYGEASQDVYKAVNGLRTLLDDRDIAGDKYFTLIEQADGILHSLELNIRGIEADLADFEDAKKDIVRECVRQGQEMYEGLVQISKGSNVKVQNKKRSILRFDIPDSVDENRAVAAITAEIDRGTMELAAEMAKGDSSESVLKKIVAQTVGSGRLLRKYVGIDSIALKAYKIDQNPEHSEYRSWEHTQVNNSGAEKFVIYFTVILALMAYSRDSYAGIAAENHSVLILDNPFGPISSRHVLEPVFDIARNYHTQLICLSDISKSEIVECFDIVIRIVSKRMMLSDNEMLTHEGNEAIEHGYYKSEQVELF